MSCPEGEKMYGGKCRDTNLYNILLYGGFGYGRLCLPDNVVDYIILIVFPPLFVFLHEYYSKKPFRIMLLITNIILTSCMYFPGMIHAYWVSLNREHEFCGESIIRDRDPNNDMNKDSSKTGADSGRSAEGKAAKSLLR